MALSLPLEIGTWGGGEGALEGRDRTLEYDEKKKQIVLAFIIEDF